MANDNNMYTNDIKKSKCSPYKDHKTQRSYIVADT